MRVLVTGATGVIGRSILPSLVGMSGVRVLAVTRGPVAQLEPGMSHGVSWVTADLTSPSDCERLVVDQDAIVHLANTSFPLTADNAVAADVLANLVPTVNLLEAIKKTSRAPQLVYLSSGGAVYGTWQCSRPWREDDECVPTTAYGIGKLAAENYIRMFAERGHMSASILRVANAYGWSSRASRPQGIVNVILEQVRRGESVRIVGNPGNIRDFVHVDDVWSAIRTVLARRTGVEVFNIGTGVGTSVSNLIELMGTILSRDIPCHVEGIQIADYLPEWNVLNIDKARSQLDWLPALDLESGLRLFVEQSL
ncbi:MAG: NAD-dependent epimerase/dehydratase family protein [Sulfobacillus sp.]